MNGATRCKVGRAAVGASVLEPAWGASEREASRVTERKLAAAKTRSESFVCESLGKKIAPNGVESSRSEQKLLWICSSHALSHCKHLHFPLT